MTGSRRRCLEHRIAFPGYGRGIASLNFADTFIDVRTGDTLCLRMTRSQTLEFSSYEQKVMIVQRRTAGISAAHRVVLESL